MFIRCCDNGQSFRVCVSILDGFSTNVNEEVALLGRINDALGPNAHVVLVQAGPHLLVEAYVNFLAVDISKSWLSVRCWTCAFSNETFNGMRRVSLELRTPIP